MQRNIALYPWFKFVQQLLFWQATWFLYFEGRLSAAEAILLYVVADVATTVLEVPSGYMSDRLGRRKTLLIAAIFYLAGTLLLVVGQGFTQFALGNMLVGASWAFASGTDSSLLFESLKAEGREADVEAMELRAWRFSYAGLALSAILGGAMMQLGEALPYVATAGAAAVLFGMTLLLQEPPPAPRTGHREDLQAILTSLRNPTLLWLFGLVLGAYVFSHIPFVFGQPFIRQALTTAGFAAEAPLVSGTVTAVMMLLSMVVSLIAPSLRKALGLPGLLLLAFGMQVCLTVALALSNSPVVIALLVLRMVPDSLSYAFIQARILPLLPSSVRATYLSLQSLAGRVIFSVTLTLAALYAPLEGQIPYADLRVILAAFSGLGIMLFGLLVLTARRAGV